MERLVIVRIACDNNVCIFSHVIKLFFLLLKVLVVSDLKRDLGYCGSTSRHRSWRNVRFILSLISFSFVFLSDK